MFLKPYKMKSNNTLKNSEKKHLVQRILEEFPTVTEEKAKELVPVKASASCMKLMLHSGDAVSVFVVEGSPLMLDTAAGLVPTVCALWRAPDLLPTLTIHTPVLSKVVGGAPLYLPGVEAGGASWPSFGKGALLAARTADNGAAALVGRAAISSGDMLLRTTGVCMEVLQVFGDQLCKDPKFCKLERPKLAVAGPPPTADVSDAGLAAHLNQLNIEPAATPVKEEWPSLGRRQEPAHAPRLIPSATPPPSHPPQPPQPPQAAPAPPPTQPQLDGNDEDTADTGNHEDEASSEAPSAMGDLLRWCLLRFLRLEGRTLQLPLKTNLLYKNHLFPYCPPDRTLDVKKSSYKKMSKFLEAMQEEGLVEVREVERGVWALTAVSPLHPAVRAHRVPLEDRERLKARATPQGESDYEAPKVAEVYCVTAAGAGLFGDLRKGTPLTSGEVRARLTEYVRTRSLNSATQKAVTLDAALAKATGKQEQETVPWESLSAGVLSRMTPGTALRWPSGETTLLRSRLEPISMAVVTRSGNKKVTLVSNLEAYGFSLPSLSRSAQLLVGASCGVTRAPGAKADQLMLQGDQTHFVAKLLIEKYGLPKKYVDGADKALNKKK